MENSRTKNSILIILSSAFRVVLTVISTFVSRTIFIHVLGADYLGLDGLFSNILSLLALSELGIGTAILFYLYKPIVNHDSERIKTLMSFYKQCYRIIGIAIIGIGLCFIPFLPIIVNFEQQIPENLCLIYILFLLNSGVSYLFWAYKQAIFIANQQQYKIEKINIIFSVINCIIDILILIVFKNYIIYLATKLLLVFIKNMAVAKYVDYEYPYLKEKSIEKIKKEEIRTIFKDIYHISIFKVGSQFLNATDNIIISIILGTIVVGYYSNYYMIIMQVSAIYYIILKSLTAGIGNVMVVESKEKQYLIYKKLSLINFVMCTIFTVCLMQLLNSFMKLWIGGIDEHYLFSQNIVVVLVISFYFDMSCQILNMYRETSGQFKVGHWRQLVAGVFNICLSILLGKIYGLFGILLATVISKFCITSIPFIAEVSKAVFNISKSRSVVSYLKEFLLMSVCVVVTWVCCYRIHCTNILWLFVEVAISVAIPITLIYMFYRKNSEFIAVKLMVIRMLDKIRKNG